MKMNQNHLYFIFLLEGYFVFMHFIDFYNKNTEELIILVNHNFQKIAL